MERELHMENHHIDCIGRGEHKYTLYVAFKDDPVLHVIGYIKYTVLYNELHVDYVEVKEEERGKGIGKALYRKLYELNKECTFKQAGLYTEQGKHIRNWFDKEILGIGGEVA